MCKKIRRLVPLPLRVEYFRIKRVISNFFRRGSFARDRVGDASRFPVPVFSHESRLIRDYPEPWYGLQVNKIANLKLAVVKLDGIHVPPGRIFSFWDIVGRTSARKGYRKGMALMDGRVTLSTGGGLCQLSNALYWTALHLGCTITERHRHSFDIFPDTKRTLPFGSGATVSYNYVDLAFRNDSPLDFNFHVFLDDTFLHVAVYADREPDFTYVVVEENHAFIVENGKRYRVNELYRIKYDSSGCAFGRELVSINKGLVLYDINGAHDGEEA
jgi:vancomycin resistance protein VanW